MPTATYIALANTTATGGQSSITFSSIPNTYRDLVLVVNGGRESGTAGVQLRFNSDTGANYSWVTASGNGTSTFSVTQAVEGSGNTYYAAGYYGNFTTTLEHLGIHHIMDYSATDKHKTILSRANRAAFGLDMVAGRWANTNAITSIQVILGGALSGTTLALYGIVS